MADVARLDQVERVVFDIIAQKAKVDPATITRATELTGLSLDSLDTIEAVFQIEETLDISLMFNANRAASSAINTAGDVVDLVAAEIARQGAAPSTPKSTPAR